MKIRGLIAAAVVLAALCGALYWSNRHNPEETSKTLAETSPKVLTLNETNVAKVAIKKKDQDQVVVAKDNAGKWQITAPKALGADQDAVSGVVSTLSSLNAERLIEEKSENLKPYGLEQPTLEVAVTQKDGKTQQLKMGADTPTGSAVYARLEGDPRIFTLASYVKTSIDKSPKDLRDKRLLTIDPDKVTRLELLAKKQDIEFGRNKDQWQILKPKPLRTDNTTVEELVTKLKDAKMELSTSDVDAKKAATAFASATAVATVRVSDASGTQELQVRKKKNDYYARSSVVEGIYKVLSDLGQQLDKNVSDFRNKKLFDFGFNNPNRIEMHDGSKIYLLTKTGEDWSSEGKKMDPGTVDSFIDKIRDLSANKFVDSGFSASALDLAVTWNDGKRVEKVLVSKKGDTYVAKRENEPALYELDSKAVEDLQKSASDLKPAPPPKSSRK